MMVARLRLFPTIVTLGLLFCGGVLKAQEAAGDGQTSSFCTFDDGKQISARYNPVPVKHNENPPMGKAWVPGGTAMTLFTETEVRINNHVLPTGAYTMYLIAGKKDWTLVVSKNVNVTAKYEEKQDLVRAAMEIGTLSEPEEQLKVSFGHLGPKRCEIDIDYGKTRAWVEFTE